jgi:hypothetical protein
VLAVACSTSGRNPNSNTCPQGCSRCENGQCKDCVAGEPVCQGQMVIACNADGTLGATVKTCDTASNEQCNAGACQSPCDVAAGTHSYIGCDYWAVTLLNSQIDPNFDYAVVIANPLQVGDVTVTNPAAHVSITIGGTDAVPPFDVMPGEVVTKLLPWVTDLSQNPAPLQGEQSAQVSGGAYHIVSSLPVTVYQFNSLEFEKNLMHCQQPQDPPGMCHSYTNDASILLPTAALEKDYLVVARQTYALLQPANFQNPNPSASATPGFFAVVATQDGTNVAVTFSANTVAGESLAAHAPGDSDTYTLDAGDVLEIVSRKDLPANWNIINPPQKPCVQMTQDVQGTYCDLGKDYDLTGTKVTADKPVEVFGGHSCSFVPYNKWACDHLEEVMFPVGTWGKEVLAVQSPPEANGEPNAGGAVHGRRELPPADDHLLHDELRLREQSMHVRDLQPGGRSVARAGRSHRAIPQELRLPEPRHLRQEPGDHHRAARHHPDARRETADDQPEPDHRPERLRLPLGRPARGRAPHHVGHALRHRRLGRGAVHLVSVSGRIEPARDQSRLRGCETTSQHKRGARRGG